MNVGFDNIAPVNRGMPPLFAAGEDLSAAAKPAGGWKTADVGAAELAHIAGEEAIDEKELRRDDPLGNLVSRAFDSATAVAALRPLPI